ncbi:MAG: dependent oxidoreductase [Mycobacterium sp.]|nr:dependent oxidoreductase [Mycobacterium sp.]
MASGKQRAIVVGAGINGASTAFWLADKGVEVVLLEQGYPASGPTGSSSALTHAFYLEPELSILADRGIKIMLDLPDIAGGPSDYRRVGMLWVVGPEAQDEWVAAVARMNRDGIGLECVDVAALTDLAPMCDLDGVGIGVWEPDGGYADPATTTTTLATGSAARGAQVRLNTSAVRLLRDSSDNPGVELMDGEKIFADQVVIAAGPWTRGLAETAGVDLPLTIERHAMAVLDTPGRAREIMPWSWCDDISGNYARPDGENIVLAGSWAGGGTGVRNDDAERGHEIRDPSAKFDRNVDDTESAEIIDTFGKRFPGFADLAIRKGYADLYDMSPDDLPLIGELPDVPGVFVIAGSSGHGFKTGPAVGEAVANLLIDGSNSLLEPFDPARFATR